VTPQDFRVGERVQLHPATDRWMRGQRYGTVAHIGRNIVYVNIDKGGEEIPIHPDNLIKIKGVE
jgi:hypothetical protein